MKTYEEYLKIIKDREYKENEAKRKRYQKLKAENPGVMYVGWDTTAESKMTFDYSVEIMGMMMQDFLKGLRTYPIQFDSKGNIKVVVDTLDTTSKEKVEGEI